MGSLEETDVRMGMTQQQLDAVDRDRLHKCRGAHLVVPWIIVQPAYLVKIRLIPFYDAR